MSLITTKKHLGQHFLKDQQTAKKIINELDAKITNQILEVGPGKGILTNILLKKYINIEAIEIDQECILYLKKKYPKLRNKIIEGNVLEFDFQNYYQFPISIIGNFPYNISSQILFKIFENPNFANQIVGMFQKEVAERITAKKGKKRGILSVFLQTYYDIKYCFTVEEDVFDPPPKVKSGVIKLTRNKRCQIECNKDLFIQIVKTSYNQRRKTLRNALKSFSLGSHEKINHLLSLRAEQLSVEDFIILTQYVKERN